MLKKEIFIKNLSEITRGMKQKEIAAIMGCTEGTMSKYKNPDKKDFPAVEMLYNLSQHFHVSIDWLVGASQEKESQLQKKLSAREICTMIAEIDNTSPIKFCTVEREEYCGEPDYERNEDAAYTIRKNQYTGLYFSNWLNIDGWECHELSGGNWNFFAAEINLFLSRLQEINSMKARGNLTAEMYNILLEKYLSDVSEIVRAPKTTPHTQQY